MITSKENLKIKNIIKLRKPKERKAQGLVVVEGMKEIEMAIQSKLEMKECYYCDDFNGVITSRITNNITCEILNKVVFKKISVRENPDGLIAVFKIKKSKIERLKLNKNPLIFILEGIEKPGNLGAIFRTADAVGVDAVILNNSRVDIYNHNVIRNSRGTVFSVPIFKINYEDVGNFLKKNNIVSVATTPNAEKNYLEIDYRKPIAILIGAEDKGLSKEWLEAANEKIKIPMNGRIDSLNVSVSTAIIAYEILRQRT